MPSSHQETASARMTSRRVLRRAADVEDRGLPGGEGAGIAVQTKGEGRDRRPARPTQVEVVMTLPDPKQVTSWGGKLLVDHEGNAIGTVTQIYTDDDTRLPEWATTSIGEATVFVPLKDAAESDGAIHVRVHRDAVAKSPLVLDRHHITPDEEARLYGHYGIAYTPERSRSGLPAGEGPVPTRLQLTAASARAVALDVRRRFTDPPTLALTAFAGVLAALLWASRRGNASSGG
jgi:hypothetical protein